METEDLQAAYLEVMMEEPGTSIATFMQRVADGRYGPQSPARVAEFLRGVERNILGSIETRAATNPRFAQEAEERADAIREEIVALIARFGTDAAHSRPSPQN